MKFSFIVFFSILVMSCNDVSTKGQPWQLPKNSKIVQVQLIDSLGSITFSLPSRYDTNYSWVHYSDCGKPCDEEKYRFQPKSLPMHKETGMFWDKPKDSVDRFTISHSSYLSYRNDDTAKNIAMHNSIIKELKTTPSNSSIIFDTIEKINDRYYSIIVIEKNLATQSKKVLGTTTIKRNEISFQYELLTKKNDSIERNFITNSIDLIRTIQINIEKKMNHSKYE